MWRDASHEILGRPGLLAHPAFLTTFAHPAEPSLVRRGAAILERVLCAPSPPPPANVPPLEALTTAGLDQRERLARHTQDPACSSCHASIDPFGGAFDGFDHLGRTRDEYPEGGTVVTAGYANVEGEEFAFGSLEDLASQLARSPRAQECYLRRIFRFASGRNEGPADVCALAALKHAFASTNGNVLEVFIALAASDSLARANDAENAAP